MFTSLLSDGNPFFEFLEPCFQDNLPLSHQKLCKSDFKSSNLLSAILPEGSLTLRKRAKEIISVGFFVTLVTFLTLFTFKESALPDVNNTVTDIVNRSRYIQKNSSVNYALWRIGSVLEHWHGDVGFGSRRWIFFIFYWETYLDFYLYHVHHSDCF